MDSRGGQPNYPAHDGDDPSPKRSRREAESLGTTGDATERGATSDSTPEAIRFSKALGGYGFLSNLFRVVVSFDGRQFASAEHAYQFGKSRRPEVAEWLDQAPHPRLCAIVAHALLPYDVRPDWATTKVDRMRAVLAVKFSPGSPLAERLLATGCVELIEEGDPFWGVGKNGKGKNMLGQLLMERRQQLRTN